MGKSEAASAVVFALLAPHCPQFCQPGIIL